MKFNSGLVTVILLCSWLNAQPINTKLGDVSLPTPTAAVLGQYVDVPISYATGVPNISVPIHSVASGPLSLDVSLTYHAGGINVATPASWTGLGWSLRAGGLVSRTQRGLADEEPTVGYITKARELTGTDKNELDQLENGRLDTEPDVFAFNFADYTGKFFFDGNSRISVIQAPDQDIEIVPEYESARIVGFTFVVPTGDVYYFGTAPGMDRDNPVGEYQDISGTSYSINPSRYLSTWHLVKVVSADAHYAIDLDYEDEVYSYLSPASVQTTQYSYTSSTIIIQGDIFKCSAQGGDAKTPQYRTESGTAFHNNVVYGKRLASITGPTTQVRFHPGQHRRDLAEVAGYSLQKARVLDRVEVSEGGNTSASKEFRFAYNYFKGDARQFSAINDFDPQQSYRYRLRLESITEGSSTSTLTLPPHSFTYHESGKIIDGYPYFPNRLSAAIDHWGHYNGQNGNNNSGNKLNVPPTRVHISYNQQTWYDIELGGADRNATAGAIATLGIIQTHTYPTGGVAKFTFESNTVSNLEEPRRVRQEIHDFELISCTEAPEPATEENCPDNYDIEATFTFESADDAAFMKYHLFLPLAEYDQIESAAYLYVYDGTDQVGSSVVAYDQNPSQHEYDRGEILVSDLISDIEIGKSYRFRLVGYGSRGLLKLIGYDLVYSNPKDQPVGGLRIKKYELLPNSSDPPIVKEFTYNTESEDGSVISSGLLLQQPNYLFTIVVNSRQPNGNGTTFYGYDLTSTPKVPLADFEGNHLAYRQVTEIIPDYGRTVMKFGNDPPIDNDPSGVFPSVPVTPDFLRGTLEEKSVYSENGTAFVAHDSHQRSQAVIPAFRSGASTPQVAYTYHLFNFRADNACPLSLRVVLIR